MKIVKYKGFKIQDNSGRITIFWETPAAYITLSVGYGFNRRGVTFKPTAVKSITGAKKTIRTLYENSRKFNDSMDAVTRRALSGGL